MPFLFFAMLNDKGVLHMFADPEAHRAQGCILAHNALIYRVGG